MAGPVVPTERLHALDEALRTCVRYMAESKLSEDVIVQQLGMHVIHRLSEIAQQEVAR